MPSVQFPAMRFAHLDSVELPQVARVKLVHPRGEPIGDVAQAVRDAVLQSRRLQNLPAGSSVAVALGSRGIAKIPLIAKAAIDTVRAMGHEPFIVPAMGSHGGGTAAGQVDVLRKLGLSEEALGAPVHATMNVVDYGVTPDGSRCKFDKNAAGADAVVVINRVKSHTTFDREIESGLVKMVAVGLGKAEGARSVHRTGPPAFMDVLPELARISLEKSPIALGIALVENAQKDLVVVEGVAPEDFFESDKRLLKVAKSFIARLPFGKMDALVVELIGKDISGAGMDYAVMGRADLRTIPNPAEPFASRVTVLGLSEATGGNGLGVGLADFSTVDVVSRIDLQQIYMNSLTSTLVEKSRIPIVLENDLDALRATVSTSWSRSDPETRLCIIRSTLHLEEILVSASLLDEVQASGKAADIGPLFDLRFDEQGRMLSHAYARDEAGDVK
ncbi:DUF362 domain-containing protein [Aureimonas fodinaquatilis]|uniref:DUF362 domain-containing protein n=1 Tax=Aureimonas fodinaquatilis TaxID=2565783 RepID=A0A5B0DWH0_9HYPH|nr:DUF362 domain-containing protein [Aureimonas fodinaquatilis]KAA0970161.1 DUF362 domain-containing protein [Aureimonas fodinaquatilis]